MKMQKTIQELINLETQRQSVGIELIASENYQSSAVLETQASVFANKYAEGFPGRRYYGGQENTDQLEQLVIDCAKEIFHADHANVQALSGAAANLCFYTAAMEPGDHILGMGMGFGGHLTHGASVTFISKVFNFHSY
jgi:glycine hydroxymethyltransferase